MKKLSSFIILLAASLLIALIAGCPTVSNDEGGTTYTVTFDSQSATVAANPMSKTVTSPATTVVTLPTPPTKTGNTFGGWWTATNGGGTAFTASTVVTASITVYAKWTVVIPAVTYTVTFDSQGADVNANPTSKTVTSPATTVGTLPTPPTKTGFTFGGWWTAVNGGGTAFTASTTVTASITVYAKWTEPFAGILYRDMAAVPAITGFSMGYANVATSVHTVTSISAFTIGKYEVTYELWNVVYIWAKANGYVFSKDTSTTTTGFCGSSGSGGATQPVTNINWRDCIVWCNAYSVMSGLQPVYCTDAGFTLPLKTSDSYAVSVTTVTLGNEDNPYVNWSATGYRLPTEAEWEECARYVDGATWLAGENVSGDTSGYCYDSGNGGTLSTIFGNYAWYDGNAGGTTKDVGTRTANALVIYDMSGNVWEWCWDWYGTYTTLSPYIDVDTKGHAYDSGNPNRMLRGGSWVNDSDGLRVSDRSFNGPGGAGYIFGFRVVKR